MSKQIKLLEDELGFQIFTREGRNLTRITPAGQQVIERALRILQETQSIRDLATELRDEGRGSLVDRHHPHPGALRAAGCDPQFRGSYPHVRLNLHQGTSEQIAEMVAQDRIDCAITTGSEHSVRRSDPPAVLSLAAHGDRAARRIRSRAPDA